MVTFISLLISVSSSARIFSVLSSIPLPLSSIPLRKSLCSRHPSSSFTFFTSTTRLLKKPSPAREILERSSIWKAGCTPKIEHPSSAFLVCERSGVAKRKSKGLSSGKGQTT